MLRSKHDRKTAVMVLILLIIALLCRFPLFHISTIPYLGAACGLLRPLIYIGFCTAWSISVSHTIINRRLRSFLKSMAFSCILWLLFRTIKFELTFRGDSVNTFLMYAYYIPFILLPTFGFFASLYARRGEQYNVPKAIYLPILCVSIGAILLVFTNPLHELFWIHTPKPYSHNVGYYAVIGWIAILAATAIANIILRTKTPGKLGEAKLPIIVLGIISF